MKESDIINKKIEELFNQYTPVKSPTLEIIAGIQGTGKSTYIETKKDLYKTYVPLYNPENRKLHPDYNHFIETGGITKAYAETEAFIRGLGDKIFGKALEEHYNILMECAFDDKGFSGVAQIPNYNMNLKIFAKGLDITYLYTIKRAVDSIDSNIPERFLTKKILEESKENADSIIESFIKSNKKVTLYKMVGNKILISDSDNIQKSYKEILSEDVDKKEAKNISKQIEDKISKLSQNQRKQIPEYVKEEIKKYL